MSLTSLSFFVFITIVFGAYRLLPSKYSWSVITFANIVFYLMNSTGKLLLCMLVMLTLNYILGRLIESRKNLAGVLSLIGVLLNVGCIIGFKELGFFTDNYNYLRTCFHLSPQDFSIIDTIIAPLGVSYCMLGQISYLLEVKWGMKAERNLLKFWTYALFFPTLISGPICRYYEISDELFAGEKITFEQLCYAVQRMLWGLFKKIVIADRLGIIVSTIWNGEYTGLIVFLGVLGYALQVYMDFSGCMDICIGVGNLFGVQLPENFNTPLYALTLSEYWRRWHITLGAWVRDYVLNPLLKSSWLQGIGKKTKKKYGKKWGRKIPTWIGMFFVWFTVGFWHGGAWTFIFGSGLFFFIMIVGGQILDPIFEKMIQFFRINVDSLIWKTFQRIRTFVLFSASISFSWSTSMKAAFSMWKRCFDGMGAHYFLDGSIWKLGIQPLEYVLIAFGLMVVFCVSCLKQSMDVREYIAKKSIGIRWAIYLALLFSVLIFGMYGPGYEASAFIYGEF